MAQAFQSFPHQVDANGPCRGAFRNKRQEFLDLARRWVGTVALISALVVLSAIMHWSA
jgi:hypothetical protein